MTSAPHAVPTALAAAFPTRTLSLRNTGAGGIGGLLLSLVFTAATIAVAWAGISSLAPDFVIRANAVPVDARIDGSCSTRKLIFTDCDVTMDYEVDGVAYSVERSFFFIGTGGNYEASVVRSGKDPSQATLDLALDKLWNRVGLALFFLAFCALLGVGTLLDWRRGAKARSRYRGRDRRRLTPVIVRITRVQVIKRKGHRYDYAVHHRGKARRRWLVLGNEEGHAFFLGHPSNDDRALAVYAQGAEDLPILLDEGLTRLDLSNDERAALFAARESLTA
ncbi:hypothetical protein [Montanilutibacter psychrotolerans]|uniref:Uncharacterized protein n=1 Tax=Montanilutibacter psychrotolerans TaxID=1327343 RepID=A0A3M8SPL5_9GAMM|nr:hypothetical protein [Lysobacter psychrotolerans]RNF82615.1 hypothetical protein EER27_14015 [Lysobacter psychrotolerans]